MSFTGLKSEHTFKMDLPSLKPKPTFAEAVNIKEEGEYRLPNAMTNGFTCVRAQMHKSHPLEDSEKNYSSNRKHMEFSFMRSVWGLHAPLKLMQERLVASKVQRLPFLPSSNIMQEALDGTDERMGFEDIFNDPSESEELVAPHVVMEKHLGLL